MALNIKICGLRDADTCAAAIAAGADMIGFAQFARSPRHVPLDVAAELIGGIGDTAETVIFSVDADDALIDAMAATGTHWLQLHGSESPERVVEVRKRSGLRVMKVLSVGTSDDLAPVAAYAEVADRLLLDAKAPKSADRPGGLGEPFDWGLLDAIDPGTQYMLAGGLTPANVAEAIRRVRPFGVDVSSGVESAPGIKSAEKIAAFIAVARGADAKSGVMSTA